jgi:hypothetical protein
MRRKGIIDGMVSCRKEMCSGIKYFVKRGEGDVTDIVEQRGGVR